MTEWRQRTAYFFLKEIDLYVANLKSVHERCTELLLENRRLKGEANVGGSSKE